MNYPASPASTAAMARMNPIGATGALRLMSTTPKQAAGNRIGSVVSLRLTRDRLP